MKHSSATESDLLLILTWFKNSLIIEWSMKHSTATESDLLMILLGLRTH